MTDVVDPAAARRMINATGKRVLALVRAGVLGGALVRARRPAGGQDTAFCSSSGTIWVDD